MKILLFSLYIIKCVRKQPWLGWKGCLSTAIEKQMKSILRIPKKREKNSPNKSTGCKKCQCHQSIDLHIVCCSICSLPKLFSTGNLQTYASAYVPFRFEFMIFYSINSFNINLNTVFSRSLSFSSNWQNGMVFRTHVFAISFYFAIRNTTFCVSQIVVAFYCLCKEWLWCVFRCIYRSCCVHFIGHMLIIN